MKRFLCSSRLNRRYLKFLLCNGLTCMFRSDRMVIRGTDFITKQKNKQITARATTNKKPVNDDDHLVACGQANSGYTCQALAKCMHQAHCPVR